MTYEEQMENIIGDWLCKRELSIPDDKCDILNKKLLNLQKKLYDKLYELLQKRPFCKCSQTEKELYSSWCQRIIETIDMIDI